MFQIESLTRIAVCVLVILSSTLLGISINLYNLVVLAIIAGISGYIVTDCLRLIQLDGILANIASMIILFVAMREFLPQDSTGKLVAVANLLVYLQSLLMFQEKTPRLIWQILTLSLLQVVIAAIFSLNLEAGLLFGSYFLVAGFTLSLQLFYSANREIARLNGKSSARARQQLAHASPPNQPAAFVFFDPEPRSGKGLKPILKHLFVWFIIAFSFTVVMFYMVPRNSNAWIGGTKIEIVAMSPSKSVDLLNQGQIQLSNQVIFRAFFEKSNSDEIVQPAEPPYFRGVALADLVIENGHTNWRAPHDRVYPESYQDLPNLGRVPGRIKQSITAEENRHPVVYAAMPAFTVPESIVPIEYCHEISALTRCKMNATLDLSPFRYELYTILDGDGNWLQTWPYYPNHSQFSPLPMSADRAQQRWLTQHHPERYPMIVTLGQTIVDDLVRVNPKPTRREICQAMEAYFLQPQRFTYTLDYRNVKRDSRLDPNEDFMRNHRSGHCEMFASALTLMLRSQNIPARLVTGFHGGDESQLTEGLSVRARHAHAWVEAYLPPEECTKEMIAQSAASPGGAWLRLDPTPPSNTPSSVGVGTEAIALARSFWQDYVLGLNNDSSGESSDLMNSQILNLFEALQFEGWEQAIFNADFAVGSNSFRYLMVALIICPPVLTWILSAYLKNRKKNRSQSSSLNLRNWLASAISLIAPGIGKWVRTGKRDKGADTQFYDRLIQILESRGIKRQPHHSQRDFAQYVSQRFSDHPHASMIASVVYEVSEIFSEIRFGKHTIPQELRDQVEQCLSELEEGLHIAG